MKHFKIIVLFIIAAGIIFLSCSKSNSSSDLKVEFKAMAEGNAIVDSAGYTVDGTETRFVNLAGATWTSGTFSIPASTHVLSVVASGPATAGGGARLTVQIFVGGVLKKEAVSTTVTNTGRITATATYSF